MLKKMVLVVVTLVLVSAVLIACCAKNDIKMSSEKLNVTDELSSYDENTNRAEFAEIKEICIANNGQSNYSIVVSKDYSENAMASAKELQKYLNLVIGASDCYKIFTDDIDIEGNFISLGKTEYSISNNIDTSRIRDDGYLIKTVDKNLYMIALDDDFLTNALYGFLEDVLECMFTLPSFDYVPYFSTIYLQQLDIVSNPDFAWRRVFQYEVNQNSWFKKLRNNGAVADEVEEIKGWGTWCHNVFTFVDPKIYMNDHPEYFSIKNKEPMQLCLTNPAIYDIIENRMAELIAEKPEMKYWDFSINDNWEYCKCKECNVVLKNTGSMMGTMLPIINKLAKKFPDKIISTLAYAYNEKVPSGMVCEPNVNIVIAPIVSGQLYSFKFGGNDKAIRTSKLLDSWGKISKNILIWDYVVNFSHLLLPYPNFDVSKDNHEFYIENNVKAVFHQGSREFNNEMAELRSYILSKQLWDNDINVSKTIAKYLKVTFGSSAKYVAKYLDDANNELKTNAKDLDLYDSPKSHKKDYLSIKNIDNYYSLINEAIIEEKDEQIIARLEKIKISILYAQMTEDNWRVNRKLNAYNEFKVLAVKHGIEQPYEGTNPTMSEFISIAYPKTIKVIKQKIATVIIVSVVVSVGCILFAMLYLCKKRKSK